MKKSFQLIDKIFGRVRSHPVSPNFRRTTESTSMRAPACRCDVLIGKMLRRVGQCIEIGYRIGSAYQSREGNFGGLYSFFPNAFIVRRADMKIVGHQQVNSYYIMFSEIASLCEGVEIGCEE